MTLVRLLKEKLDGKILSAEEIEKRMYDIEEEMNKLIDLVGELSDTDIKRVKELKKKVIRTSSIDDTKIRLYDLTSDLQAYQTAIEADYWDYKAEGLLH